MTFATEEAAQRSSRKTASVIAGVATAAIGAYSPTCPRDCVVSSMIKNPSISESAIAQISRRRFILVPRTGRNASGMHAATVRRMVKYILPDLPYDYSALAPHISARVLELHHGKHHATYVEKANKALEQLD